jgi:hypothetical protein
VRILYQPMLALHDVLVSVCAGILGTWLSADVFFLGRACSSRFFCSGFA